MRVTNEETARQWEQKQLKLSLRGNFDIQMFIDANRLTTIEHYD